MNMNNFRVVHASLPDRENLVIEVFYQDTQWAEISREEEKLTIDFFPIHRPTLRFLYLISAISLKKI
jgi:hypothetical protein